jgi:ABC-type sugar transport system ATPase subunit
MLLYLIIGETGSGKSTLAKHVWNKSTNAVVYDFQNEYEGRVYSKNDLRGKFKILPTTHEPDLIFDLDKILHGYTFILEECTGLFATGKVPERYVKRILSKRHTKNNWVLIFHSIQDVPPRFFRFCDVVILFRTGDFEKDVRNKVPQYVEHYTHLQNSNVKKISPQGYPISDFVTINRSNLSKKTLE